jgi:hypothetical protein
MRIRSSLVRNALISGSAVAAALSLSHHVEARSTLAGVATTDQMNMNCFEVYYGTLTNRCSTRKTLILPIAVQDAGSSETVKVTGYNQPGPGTNLGCRVEVYEWWGGLSAISEMTYVPGGDGEMVMSVYKPVYGYLIVSCSLDPNDRINVVNWSW